MDIVFGWDRNAISRGRMKSPIPQDRDDSFVDSMAQSLKEPFFHYHALCVNGDLNNNVSLFHSLRQLRGIDQRIR